MDGCNGLDEAVRASGDCLCRVCNHPYFDHPNCKQSGEDMGFLRPVYYLHVLCDGTHVKL